MKETLIAIILLLLCIIAVSSVAALLLIGADARKTGILDNARKTLIILFFLEFTGVAGKIVQILYVPDVALDYKLLDLPYMIILLWFQSLFYTYPLNVLKPDYLNWKRWILINLPFFVPLGIYLLIDFPPLNLYTQMEVIDNIHTADVLYRIIVLALLVAYSTLGPILTFRARKVSISSIGLLVLSITLIFLTLLIAFYMITAIPYFYIVYLIVALCANVYLIYYELSIREKIKDIRPEGQKTAVAAESQDSKPINEHANFPTDGQKEMKTSNTNNMRPSEKIVFENIKYQFEVRQIWKYPNLDIKSLAKEIGSNRTYIQQCIRKETGLSYTEYVNGKRVDNVIRMMKSERKPDLQTIFKESGFSSRTTAWRNFKSVTGMTPSEYLKKIDPV